jgi:hypothetical protein
MTSRVDILTPVGRLVQGSLYKANEKDAEGKPLVVKSGPNAGQPRKDFYFAIAIPKDGRNWWETEWGALIYRVGATAFPQACQSPTFAWKVKDGDSTIPNRKGKAPRDQEGYPGNWVLSFSSGYPPKVFRDGGTVPLTEEGAVNLGDFVQVFGQVDGNGSQSQPGIYLNHSMVDLSAYGPRIVVGPDASSVGFGKNVQLPPGASATPLASAMTPAVAAAVAGPRPGMPPAMPGAPVMPGIPPQMPGAAAVVMPATAGTVVAPHPGILTPPGVPAVPAVPPAAPVRQMTAKAGGATYQQFIDNGWNDQQLIQQGYMLA